MEGKILRSEIINEKALINNHMLFIKISNVLIFINNTTFKLFDKKLTNIQYWSHMIIHKIRPVVKK